MSGILAASSEKCLLSDLGLCWCGNLKENFLRLEGLAGVRGEMSCGNSRSVIDLAVNS